MNLDRLRHPAVKWFLGLLVVALLASLTVSSIVGANGGADEGAYGGTGGDSQTKGKLIVTGRAEVKAQPDMAQFDVGVDTRAETLEEARAANAKAMEQVRERILAAGADEKSLRTKGFTVYPEWHYGRDGTTTLVGYRVTHTLQVTVDDLDLLGPMLDAAMKEGANQISGPTFGLKNPEALEVQALQQAVRKARVKADTLAEASGVSIKGVVEISEHVNTPVGGAIRATFMAADAVMESAATSISPGEVSVTATVTMTFEI